MTRCHRAARFSTPKFDSLQPLPDYTPQSFLGQSSYNGGHSKTFPKVAGHNWISCGVDRSGRWNSLLACATHGQLCAPLGDPFAERTFP